MLIDRENPHGGDIYRNAVRCDFSANISPLGTPEAVRQAVRDSAELLCAYPDPYCTRLRAALSEAVGVPAEHILCGNGAAELIFQFAAAAKPRRALIVTPTFCEYEQALRAAGCACDHFPLRPETAFALPASAPDAVPGHDLVVLCNPNNPTGRTCPRSVVRTLAERCRAAGARLLLDECFCDIADEPAECSLLPDIEQLPNVLILKAFTKSYGMAGVRLGYAVCADEALLAAICGLGQVWNVSTPAQMAGLAALGCAGFLQKEQETVRRERAFLAQGLEQAGCRVFPSQANFLLLQSPVPLYEKLLERGILIRRCGNFPGLDDSYYRCAVKDHACNTALIGAMEEILHG